MASAQDCKICLDIDVEEDKQGRNFNLTEYVMEEFPNLKVMVSTFRDVVSADHNILSAVLRDQSGFFSSREFTIRDIVDSIGSGDAFAAGIIYGLVSRMGGQEILDFSTAAAALKHTIVGDANRVCIAEINDLLNDQFMGQIKR